MAARSPSPMSVRVGLWALAVAAGEWTRAATRPRRRLGVAPATRAGSTAATCCAGAAHEVVHHEKDVRWGLA